VRWRAVLRPAQDFCNRTVDTSEEVDTGEKLLQRSLEVRKNIGEESTFIDLFASNSKPIRGSSESSELGEAV